MAGHRWSGWPGAWCLDCGVPDPGEEALAHDCIDFVCPSCDQHWAQGICKESGLDHMTTAIESNCGKHGSYECTEPGSGRYNPYLSATP